MRVLVIGGTGFIGRHVSRLLDAAGCEVTVFHRGLTPGRLPGRVRHVRHAAAAIPVVGFPEDVRDLEPEVVVHMIPVGGADAEAALRAFRGVARRLVAISSGDVYQAYGRLIGIEPTGEHAPRTVPEEGAPGALLAEDAPLRTTLYPYGSAVDSPWGTLRDYEKILVERAVMGEPELPGTILRLPKVYGPGSPGPIFLPWIKRMDDRRPAILVGEAQARWRWTHGYVENVAAAIALAARDDRAAGRIYNVGERSTPDLGERVQSLARVTGWSGRLVSVPDDRLPAHLRPPYPPHPDLAYDTTRLRVELGYAEPVEEDEALARTAEWERGQADRWLDPAALDYAVEDAVLGSTRRGR